MSVARGTIVVTQETRFRLITDEGRAMLFLLAHDSSIEPQDLALLQAKQPRVRVLYTPAAGLVAGLARDIIDDAD